MLEFNAGIFGGEVPVCLGVTGFAVLLPGGDFNEIKECALISQCALTDLVPAGLDNVGALAH